MSILQALGKAAPARVDDKPSRLLALPEELLYRVLDFVPVSQLVPVADTSARLREMVLNPSYVAQRTCEASTTHTYRHVVKTNLKNPPQHTPKPTAPERLETRRALDVERHSPAWTWAAPLALRGGEPLRDVALSSRYVLGSSRRGELLLWDLSQRHRQPRNLRAPRGGGVTLGGGNSATIYGDRWVALSLDGRRRGAFVWDTRSPAMQAVHVGAHSDATASRDHVTSLCLRRQENMFVSTHPTSDVVGLWDFNHAGQLTTVPLPPGLKARGARLLPDNSLLALTNGGVFIYPRRGTEAPRPITVAGTALDCDQSALSANENYLLLARTQSDTSATVWRVDGDWRAPIASLPADPAIRHISFFGTSARVNYTRDNDPNFYLWDPQNNHTITLTPQLGGSVMLNAVPFDRDRKVAVVLCELELPFREALEIYDLGHNEATLLRATNLPRSNWRKGGTQLFPHPDGERFWTTGEELLFPKVTRLSLIDPNVVTRLGVAKATRNIRTRAADFASNGRRAAYLEGGSPRVVDISEVS